MGVGSCDSDVGVGSCDSHVMWGWGHVIVM